MCVESQCLGRCHLEQPHWLRSNANSTCRFKRLTNCSRLSSVHPFCVFRENKNERYSVCSVATQIDWISNCAVSGCVRLVISALFKCRKMRWMIVIFTAMLTMTIFTLSLNVSSDSSHTHRHTSPLFHWLLFTSSLAVRSYVLAPAFWLFYFSFLLFRCSRAFRLTACRVHFTPFFTAPLLITRINCRPNW